MRPCTILSPVAFVADYYSNLFSMLLKSLSFRSKECTKELKLECANFLGQTS